MLFGQSWSLLTMNQVGVNPLRVNNPPTIDGGYVPGFNWTRQPQFRVAKSFDKDTYWLALSVENPQTTYANTSVPSTLGTLNVSNPGIGGLGTGSNSPTAVCTAVTTTTTTTTTGGARPASKSTSTSTCTTSNVAGLGNFTNNLAPDVIAKATADYPIAHLEAYGIGRVFNDRVSQLGTGQSNTVFGGGAGAAALFHVIPKKLDIQVSGLAGTGIRPLRDVPASGRDHRRRRQAGHRARVERAAWHSRPSDACARRLWLPRHGAVQRCFLQHL